jgi:hypothetical protein
MILIVYAGFLWMTARGNEQTVEKAQTIIRSSVIGLIIVLGAYSITSFIVPALIERTTGSATGGALGTCAHNSGTQINVTSAACEALCAGTWSSFRPCGFTPN